VSIPGRQRIGRLYFVGLGDVTVFFSLGEIKNPTNRAIVLPIPVLNPSAGCPRKLPRAMTTIPTEAHPAAIPAHLIVE